MQRARQRRRASCILSIAALTFWAVARAALLFSRCVFGALDEVEVAPARVGGRYFSVHVLALFRGDGQRDKTLNGFLAVSRNYGEVFGFLNYALESALRVADLEMRF